MPDYDLTSLGPRSFEQLVQSIALQKIGPGLVIFGDGPDGGREATFESYQAQGQSWTGYGVLQCKHRTRPTRDARDTRWLMEQVESDLKSMKGRPEQRRPQYYIVATNVILTPALNAGSRDLLQGLLQHYIGTGAVQDCDVWDYDKLCRFLDSLPAIRTTYLASITAGDVLARFFEQSTPTAKSLEEAVPLFVQKELLADQYANLAQAGHATDDRIPLARVFFDVPLDDGRLWHHATGSPPRLVAELLRAAHERLDSLALPYDESRPATLQPGRFVLVGGPGQGKTTVGQFLCQLFRAALLKDMDSSRLAPEVREAVGVISEQARAEELELPGVRRLPIRISLNEFADWLSRCLLNHNSAGGSLLSYLCERMQRRTNENVSAANLREFLRQYPSLVLLDGLDEVPASSNRKDVLQAIDELLVDVAALSADVMVVATTRPQGYNDDFSPTRYRHLKLAPLPPAMALHYADRLTAARYGADHDRQHRVMDHLKRAIQHEATAHLLRSPLQVTIMATLIEQGGQPPQERWRLFHEYYETIYKRETERNMEAAAVLREHKPDIDAIHCRLGLLLQSMSEGTGGTEARISMAAFDELVEARLQQEDHPREKREALRKVIRAAATDRLVFLVAPRSEEVGFEIRSLQEFMAAEALMADCDERVRANLNAVAGASHWRMVFLFAAGKCFAEQGRQHLRDTIVAICAQRNDQPDDPAGSRALLGSQLAIGILEDGALRTQPKYLTLFGRLALRTLTTGDPSSLRSLAEVYEEGLADLFEDETERALMAGSCVVSEGAWHLLVPLVERNVKWAVALAEKHWPTAPAIAGWVLRLVTDEDSSFFGPRYVSVLSAVPPGYVELEEGGFGSDWGGTIQGAARWVKSAVRMVEASHDGIRGRGLLRLAAVAGGDLRLAIARVTDWSREMGDISEMPDPCVEWRVVQAGAAIRENPTGRVLAASLLELAELVDERAFMWVTGLIPWPLAACLAGTTPQERRGLAAKADAGGLGGGDEWKRAEARWKLKGITEPDLRWSTAERWPFDETIGRRGFPLYSGLWPLFYGGRRGSEHQRVGSQLVELGRKIESPRAASVLADWVAAVRTVASGMLSIDDATWVAEHATIGCEELVLASAVAAGGGEEWIELVCRAAGGNMKPDLSGGELSSQLETYYCRTRDARVLPVLASWFAAGDYNPSQAVVALASEGATTRAEQLSAVILSVATSVAVPRESEWVVVTLGRLGPLGWSELAVVLAATGRMADKVASAILMSLWQSRGLLAREDRWQVSTAMSTLLRRRKSSLTAGELAERFGIRASLQVAQRSQAVSLGRRADP